MTTTYPNFIPLTIEHKDYIQDFHRGFRPYSDFNFISMLAWNVDGRSQISTLNGNLIIKMPNYNSDELIVSILGDNLIDDTIEELLKSEKQLNLVPETVVKNIKTKKKLKIIEDDTGHDYIFSLSKLSKLPGKDYKNKRKLQNRFIKEYGNSISLHTNLDINEYKKDVDKLLKQWGREKSKEDYEIKAELLAINKLLDFANEVDVIWTGLFLGDKLIGFSVNEIINKDYANCHFHKTIPSYKYSDVYLTNETSKMLKSDGCKYINWEQDLGLEGLRLLKQSYKPTKYLKKYSISYN